MKNILGLDIGTNSIGWALIQEDAGYLKSIEAMGSRIIPEGDEHREFEKGQDISKNATRRMKRGSRRMNERYKQRRNNLILLCKTLGITPKGLEPLFDKIVISDRKIVTPQGAFKKGDIQYKPYELFELRNRALNEKVSLEELFRIIYHFNQRRGFKSNKKVNKSPEEEKENDENDKRNRLDIAVDTVRIVDVKATGQRLGKQGKEELVVTLEDGRTAISDKYIFKKFIGQNVVLEIKRITLKSGELKYSFSLPTRWQRNRKELNDDILKSGGFPGKYFYEEYLRSRANGKEYEFKVRENVVNRDLYENEFRAIWKKQCEFYKDELSNHPLYQKAIEAIIPINNKEEKERWKNRELGDFIMEYIVFYQRDLKSQVKLIGNCRFEEKQFEKVNKETGEVEILISGPKCCPKSHPQFQEFRIWQQINNLICYDIRQEEVSIDEKIKESLFDYLNERDEAKREDIEKFLRKLSKTIDTTNIAASQTWAGNRTKHFFSKVFKNHKYNGSPILSNHEKYLQLWHLLYSVGDPKGIRSGLKKIDPELPDEIVKLFFEIDYKEKQYASLSLKAINNLLPLMRCGKYFTKENFTRKNIERIKALLANELNEDIDPKTLQQLKMKREVSEFNSLSYYEAASLIYGKHTAKQGEKYTVPDEIKPVPRHSLRNPVVEQVVNETLMLVKDIWTKYPELSKGEIRIELARELKSNKDQRARVTKLQESNKEVNREVVDEIRRHKGEYYNPTLAEIEKVKLWHESGERSVYTGKVLNVSEVLSSYTEIDHVIPRSRFYNDGMTNKVICESHINADKDRMTAMEYMTTGTPCQADKMSYDNYLQFIRSQRIPFAKRKLLVLTDIPDDFVERQIKDTQMISIRIKEELGRIVGNNNVKATTGQVTDYLKDQWGVSELMKRIIKPRFEMLEKKFNLKLVSEEDVTGKDGKPTGRKRTVIKGFSKRFDHRHHALDALIVACTRQGIIQQLNKLNQIAEGRIKQYVETIGGSYRRFVPPTGQADKDANRFYAITEEALYSIVISFKNKKRLVTKANNIGNKYVPENGRIEKVVHERKEGQKQNWAIRGRLHAETNYGIVNHNGELRHTTRCKLSDLTKNKIENILDGTLKSEIQRHLIKPDYNGEIKNAFGNEGLIEFNKDRKIPVFSVKVTEDGVVGNVSGKTALYDSERKLDVEKSANFCVVIYEKPETKIRKFDIVSFFDAVQLKTSGQDPYETEVGLALIQEGFVKLFSLTHFDLVYVPIPGENDVLPQNVTDLNYNAFWFDKFHNRLDRIYRVVKFSGSRIYFQPHVFSQEITIHEGRAKNSMDYKGEFAKGTNGTMTIIGTMISIQNNCIKIEINRLGEISLK